MDTYEQAKKRHFVDVIVFACLTVFVQAIVLCLVVALYSTLGYEHITVQQKWLVYVALFGLWVVSIIIPALGARTTKQSFDRLMMVW